jgi:hypothetical protein
MHLLRQQVFDSSTKFDCGLRLAQLFQAIPGAIKDKVKTSATACAHRKRVR